MRFDPPSRARHASRARAWATACALVTAIITSLVGAGTASAATVTLLPTGEIAASPNIVTSSCATRTDCIAEAVPGSVDDADTLQSSVAGTHYATFSLAVPPTVHRVHVVEVRLRGRCLTGGATYASSITLFDNALTQIGAVMPVTLTSTMTNQSIYFRSLNLTAAQVNAASVRIAMGSCTTGTSAIAALSAEMTYSPLITDEVLVPNAPRTGTPAMIGGCSPNAWSCVNLPYGAGDATYIENTSGCFGNDVSSFQLSDPAYRAREVISVRQGARAQMENVAGSSNVEAQVFWTAGNTTNYSGAVTSGGAWQTKEAAATTVSLTDTQIVGAYVQVRLILGTCVKERVADINVKATYGRGSIVSGTALDAPGGGRWGECDSLTANVTVAVDGVNQPSVTCNAITGAWSTSVVASQDSIVTAYLDDPTPASNGGVTYTKLLAASTDVTGISVTKGEVRVAGDAGFPVTLADLAGDDAALDAVNVPVTVTGSAITVANPATLVVAQGTFDTGTGTITTPRMRIDAGATLDVGATHQVILTGSDTGACTAGVAARPLCAMAPGTTADALDVRYTGTSTTDIDGFADYRNLQLQPASGAPTYNLGSINDITLTVQGTLTIGTGAAAVTASTTTYSPVLDVTGAASIAALATLSGTGTGTLTFAGDLTGGGAVALTAGSVMLRNAGSNTNLSATGAGSTWQFATLEASTSGAIRSVTVPGASRGIDAATTLRVGRTADANIATLTTSAMTQPVTVTGDVDITSHGLLNAPPSLVVHGNFTNSGSVAPGTGTVTIAGTGTSTLTSTGTGTLYRLTSVVPGKFIELASNGLAITNLLTLTGSTCASPVTLRSTVPGIQRTITTAGATFSITNAAIGDTATTTPATANNSGDLDGNTNVTFTGTPPCAAPTNPHTHRSNAGSGFVQPVAIDGAGAFHMSVRNATGLTADHVRTTVRSSLLDSSVAALWRLNAGTPLADESALGNSLINAGATDLTGTRTDFGTHATFNGFNYLAAPANPAYQLSVFTLEAWIKPTSMPYAQALIVWNASDGGINQHTGIYLDQSDATIRGFVGNTTANAGDARAPYAGLFDGQWHHVALTIDGANAMRLYVDGAHVGSNTFTGTMVQPTAPMYIGGTNILTAPFVGSIDDVQLTNRAMSAAEISGYYATNRQHYDQIWTNGPTGQTISCATTDRCDDVAYAGPNIHRIGARYYAQHQLRTTGGWSATASDWFETRDVVTVTAPPTMTLSAAAPGVDSTTSGTVTTVCLNPTGCTLSASSASDTVALTHTVTSDPIPPATPVSPAAPGGWPVSTARGLGATVLTTSSGKDTSRWGTGTTFTPLTDLNYQGLTTTPSMLVNTTVSGTETTAFGLRLNVGSGTTAGSYAGTVQIIAVPNL